jgi:hypothetical protein
MILQPFRTSHALSSTSFGDKSNINKIDARTLESVFNNFEILFGAEKLFLIDLNSSNSDLDKERKQKKVKWK